MANTFVQKATKFVSVLDNVYKKAAVTSILDVNAETLEFVGTNKVKLPKIVLQGAADYDRANGYVNGSVTVDYSEHELQYDRGRSFSIDVIDDDEAAFDLFATVSTEYVRRKEVPEVDAIRFAEIYAKANAGNGTIVDEDLTATTSLKAFDTAEETLGDNEVSEEDRILFVSHETYKNMKQSDQISRRMDVNTNDGDVDRRIETLDGIVPIIKVPKSRFYDIIALNDGTTAGQEDGGFEPTSSVSREINFILADRTALMGITKRNASKIITADVNQTKDANDVKYRMHHDLIVPENKTPGIYISRKTTAIS